MTVGKWKAKFTEFGRETVNLCVSSKYGISLCEKQKKQYNITLPNSQTYMILMYLTHNYTEGFINQGASVYYGCVAELEYLLW